MERERERERERETILTNRLFSSDSGCLVKLCVCVCVCVRVRSATMNG